MKELFLPVKIQQEILSYTKFALPLCVVMLDDLNSPWIELNFMGIKSTLSVSPNGNNFTYLIDNEFSADLNSIQYGDVLQMKSFSWSEIGCPVSFLMNILRDGFYVHVQLNEFYISAKASFGIKDFIHPSLIYGFCEDSQSFQALGFSKNGIFCSFKIGFSEVINATKSVENNMEIFDSHKNFNLYIYRPVDNRGNCFKTEFLKNIASFCESPKSDRWMFGVESYQILFNYLDGCQSGDRIFLKYNTVRFLYEQKNVFRSAILRMENILKVNDFCSAKYRELNNKFNKLRCLHIDLSLADRTFPHLVDEKSLKIIKRSLVDIYLFEKDLVNEIYEYFHKKAF